MCVPFQADGLGLRGKHSAGTAATRLIRKELQKLFLNKNLKILSE